DHGEVIKSTTANNYNCIDPELIVDYDNKVWLAFGSFWSGMKMIAIDPATGKQLASNKTIYAIAGRGGGAIEGPSLSKNNGYYYLFVAWDKCCDGINSTYRTMMGRSQNITGPYVDKTGKDLNSSGGTQMLARYGRYIGPGGGSPFTDGRRTYFVNHYYNANQNGAANLQIREIVYDNTNWPNITQPFLGRRQSFEAEHAQITNADILTTNAASNSEYIGNIDATDSRVVFHINALQGGEYTVRIRFSSPAGASSHFLKVNSGAETEILYPASPAIVDFPESRVILKTVTLTEGYNILTFRKGNGVAHLDRIDLVRSAKNSIEGGSFDDSKIVDYVAAGNNANFSSGDYAQFENIDFGQGGNVRALISFSGSCNGQIKLAIDGNNGTVSTTNSVNVSAAVQDHSIVMPAVIANLNGIHDLYMTYTGTGGCALDHLKFTSTITGLEEDQLSSHISVYPNPFTNSFEILSDTEVNYEVLDMMGKLITKGVSSGLRVINLEGEKGTYFVRLFKNGQNPVVRKIIKN
ncbi:MAG: family 43 glycosylhydrolase, partial [Opitutaceae bacterium]|nr:family 43 glycosylhydrolase [Cytophagales bacterium]